MRGRWTVIALIFLSLPPSLIFMQRSLDRTPLPPPTEHRLDREAEKRNGQLRREWIEQMHRTAPDVDWRAIEGANGRNLQERRNRESVNRSKTAADEWFEIGSRNLAGRMHCVALAPSGDSLYAGSSLGGVWKADLNGEGWRPLGDNLFGGSHGLAVAEGPVETITSITDNGEIHFTTDGGLTWHRPTGLYADPSEGKRVVRDYSAAGRIYLILRDGVTSGKVYVSEDGGASYSRIMRLLADQGDLWIDRVGGGDLYVQKGLQTFRTSDQGASWDTLGTIPAGSANGVILTGSEAGAPTLYSAIRNGSQWELYRSTDAGSTWTYRHDINDFWETLEASIVNRDIVLFAGVECWRSTNGGGSFARVNSWGDYYSNPLHKLHADNPGMHAVWTPTGEIIFNATDGGLYRSDDQVATVTNISMENLGVSQYYTTLTSINDPERIVAGAQDQGFQRTTGTSVGTLLDFDQLISGDYAHLTSSNGNHRYVFSVYPGFILVTKGEDPHYYFTSLDFPPGESYPWLPFIQSSYEGVGVFYFCGKRLYRYYRTSSDTWTYEQLPHDFSQGGSAFLTAFAISPADTLRRYAVTNTGAPWYTADAGSTWTRSPDNGPSYNYLYGTAIAPSPDDVDLVYLGGSGYSGPAVYRSVDGGVSWKGAGTGLPSTMVYELAFEGTGSGALYAATEAGPYRFDPTLEEWSYLGGSIAPLTTYWCVEPVVAAGVMRFGTYGRGIWDYDYTVATNVAAGEERAPASYDPALLNFPNPFNPTTTIHYRLERDGRHSLVIYDPAGRQVRQLSEGRAAAGEHQVVWDGRNDRGEPVGSGVYLARLESEDGAKSRRITLLR